MLVISFFLSPPSTAKVFLFAWSLVLFYLAVPATSPPFCPPSPTSCPLFLLFSLSTHVSLSPPVSPTSLSLPSPYYFFNHIPFPSYFPPLPSLLSFPLTSGYLYVLLSTPAALSSSFPFNPKFPSPFLLHAPPFSFLFFCRHFPSSPLSLFPFPFSPPLTPLQPSPLLSLSIFSSSPPSVLSFHASLCPSFTTERAYPSASSLIPLPSVPLPGLFCRQRTPWVLDSVFFLSGVPLLLVLTSCYESSFFIFFHGSLEALARRLVLAVRDG